MTQTPILDEIIPAGKPWSAIVPDGHYLTIIDLEGQQGVDFLCYNADNPEERYHAPNTLKAIQTLKLTTTRPGAPQLSSNAVQGLKTFN